MHPVQSNPAHPAQNRVHPEQPDHPAQNRAHSEQPDHPAQNRAHPAQPDHPAQNRAHPAQPDHPPQNRAHSEQPDHPPQNRAHSEQPDHPAVKENLRSLHGKKLLQYLWDYYKLPLAVLCITTFAVISILHSRLTRKEVVLYTALVNVAAGGQLTEKLDSLFLQSQNIDASKNMLYLYTGLYLTDDADSAFHAYTYASRTKILAAIDAEQLDVVLMNQEAFDAFSQNGYLCSMDELLAQKAPALFPLLEPQLAENTVILEDNQIDLYLDDSADYHARTEKHLLGLDLSDSPIIREAGFEDTVYLGVLKNSPRKDAAAAYLQYLYEPME